MYCIEDLHSQRTRSTSNFLELLMASPSGKGVQIVIVTKVLLGKWARSPRGNVILYNFGLIMQGMSIIQGLDARHAVVWNIAPINGLGSDRYIGTLLPKR